VDRKASARASFVDGSAHLEPRSENPFRQKGATRDGIVPNIESTVDEPCHAPINAGSGWVAQIAGAGSARICPSDAP
jgi:hypothetical protein